MKNKLVCIMLRGGVWCVLIVQLLFVSPLSIAIFAQEEEIPSLIIRNQTQGQVLILENGVKYARTVVFVCTNSQVNTLYPGQDMNIVGTDSGPRIHIYSELLAHGSEDATESYASSNYNFLTRVCSGQIPTPQIIPELSPLQTLEVVIGGFPEAEMDNMGYISASSQWTGETGFSVSLIDSRQSQPIPQNVNSVCQDGQIIQGQDSWYPTLPGQYSVSVVDLLDPPSCNDQSSTTIAVEEGNTTVLSFMQFNEQSVFTGVTNTLTRTDYPQDTLPIEIVSNPITSTNSLPNSILEYTTQPQPSLIRSGAGVLDFNLPINYALLSLTLMSLFTSIWVIISGGGTKSSLFDLR